MEKYYIKRTFHNGWDVECSYLGFAAGSLFFAQEKKDAVLLSYQEAVRFMKKHKDNKYIGECEIVSSIEGETVIPNAE
jgi:hypothetical protein